jgi:hypothetical protein
MNVNLEALLRGLGLFLGVYFTTGWSLKSPPMWDTVLMIMCVCAGMASSFTSGKASPQANLKANLKPSVLR